MAFQCHLLHQAQTNTKTSHAAGSNSSPQLTHYTMYLVTERMIFVSRQQQSHAKTKKQNGSFAPQIPIVEVSPSEPEWTSSNVWKLEMTQTCEATYLLTLTEVFFLNLKGARLIIITWAASDSIGKHSQSTCSTPSTQYCENNPYSGQCYFLSPFSLELGNMDQKSSLCFFGWIVQSQYLHISVISGTK